MSPARVRLRPITVDQATDLCAGRRGADWHPEYPLAESLDAAGMFLQTSAVLDPGPWSVFWIVADGQVVGDAGFHGPPGDRPDTLAPPGRTPPTVEIGYSVVPGLRRRGLATAAVGLLLDLAWRHGAGVVLAETSPDNLASQHVLRRAGFASTGSTPAGELTYATRRPEPAP
jgi:RimJ/RimL family protein N-acetyltransferase